MNTAYNPAGWHPDPNQTAGMLRWWDGSRWTEHTQLAPTFQQSFPTTTTVAAAPAAYPAYGQTVAAERAAQFTASPGPTTHRSQQSLIERNSTSFTTMGVVAGYVLLAAATGIVLFGIVPVMLAIRAFNRGEQLAPLAMLSAAAAVLLALSVLTPH